MKCDTCFHKPVCHHYSDIKTDTYAYMGVRFNPDECENYVNVDDVSHVKYGHWIVEWNVHECSKCGQCFEYEGYMGHMDFFNYCPNCGAKMTLRK